MTTAFVDGRERETRAGARERGLLDSIIYKYLDVDQLSSDETLASTNLDSRSTIKMEESRLEAIESYTPRPSTRRRVRPDNIFRCLFFRNVCRATIIIETRALQDVEPRGRSHVGDVT